MDVIWNMYIKNVTTVLYLWAKSAIDKNFKAPRNFGIAIIQSSGVCC